MWRQKIVQGHPVTCLRDPLWTRLAVAELDESHWLLECVLGVAAGVEDVRAQRDAPQQAGVRVDLVEGVQHRLHALEKAESGGVI